MNKEGGEGKGEERKRKNTLKFLT
jgi:hypothetical protein